MKEYIFEISDKTTVDGGHPSVKREEIVRCKDCRWWDKNWRCDLWNIVRSDMENFYCASGKRKNEADEIMIECPLCGKLHPVDRRIRTATVTIKGEKIKYQEEYYVCGENEYVPAKVMDANLLAARDAYRSAHQTFTTTSTDGKAEVRLAPVIHGKWMHDKDDTIITGYCSQCGWLSIIDNTDVADMPYCPHCGCKMDKVNDV